jgi:hypothetical protein
MRGNRLVKKIVGGVLALGAIGAIGLGSASTASAQDRFIGREGVRVEARFAPAPVVVYHDNFRRDRFYSREHFYGPRDRCWRR